MKRARDKFYDRASNRARSNFDTEVTESANHFDWRSQTEELGFLGAGSEAHIDRLRPEVHRQYAEVLAGGFIVC